MDTRQTDMLVLKKCRTRHLGDTHKIYGFIYLVCHIY